MENKVFCINDLSNIYKNINHAPANTPTFDYQFNLNKSDELFYSSEFKEWVIILDNFPSPRKSFKWNLTIKTYSDFEVLLGMAGVKLERNISDFEKAIKDTIENPNKENNE